MDKLGLKDSSHDLQPNCAISFFPLYVILHACVQRFDGMDEKLLERKVYGYCNIFVCICQLVSNHRLTRLKKSSYKLKINYIVNYFLFIFNTMCMCRKT